VNYLYSAYGLTLKSRLAIPGLNPLLPGVPASNHEIEISVGERPRWVSQALALSSRLVFPAESGDQEPRVTLRLSELGGGRFFHLSYSDDTCFVVDARCGHIWGCYPPSLTLEDLTTYLMGPVMGFVLRQRHVLALHASCFNVGGHAFALCGGPGTGKSTAAAGMALRGIPILCEDIAALHERSSGFFVSPAYPRINLWPPSAISLFGKLDSLPRITPSWGKRFLSLNGKALKFDSQERALAAVYVVDDRSADHRAPGIEMIASAKEAALRLVQNTYMNYLLDARQRAQEFDSIARLVSTVSVRRLVPHRDLKRLGAMCELLVEDATRFATRAERQAVDITDCI